MKKIIPVIALLFLSLSCKKEVIRPGQTYSKGDLNVEFVDFSDSRCPTGVQCFWAGEGTGFFVASKDGESENFSLRIGENLDIMGYSVRLDGLTPYPETGVTISVNNKKADLNIEEL